MNEAVHHDNHSVRQAFYDRLEQQHLAPLWPRLPELVTLTPRSRCQPHLWRYADLYSAAMEAGSLVNMQEAERRVIILENPGLQNSSCITTTLYAGLQMIQPGEIAPSHRHSQSAIRLAMSGDGAYTVVDNERTLLQRGDLVLTPPMVWHDHGNDGDEPATWLDGLDIPLVQFFDASFLERATEPAQAVTRNDGDSWYSYARSMRAVDDHSSFLASPVVNYPYQHAKETLLQTAGSAKRNPFHGTKMAYLNPLNGGHVLPTMAAFLQLLNKGLRTAPYRSSDATVYVVQEGSGRTWIGEHDICWGPRDIFVVPSWHWIRHQADEEAVLFSYSDRPAQEKLGLWREQCGENE